jgi:hypothetical protein
VDACCENVSVVHLSLHLQCIDWYSSLICISLNPSSSSYNPPLSLLQVASSAYSHTKQSSVRTLPPSPHLATPLVDPSLVLDYPLRPTSTTQPPRNEHNWNALAGGGVVTRAVVVGYFPIPARVPYLEEVELVVVLLRYPNFTVITYPRYQWPNKLTISGIDEHWDGRLSNDFIPNVVHAVISREDYYPVL